MNAPIASPILEASGASL